MRNQHEETEGILEGIEDVHYQEPDLFGGVEGVEYTIAYGLNEGHEEESDNYTSSLVARASPNT
jgi:hypothetical protein